MNLRLLYHMARADFLERSRRYSFLAAVAGAVYFGYLINAGYVNLILRDQRGILNSAWVGTLTGLAAGLLLPLFGFYLVKNTLERDRQTRVGEILAATPLSRAAYTGGKAVSNFLFLTVILAVLAVAGLLLQLLAGEDRQVDLLAFFSPLLGLALPPIAFVSAVAVLFEAVRWLRGALGNAIYFFVWTGIMASAIAAPSIDIIGWNVVQSSLFRQIPALAPRPGESGDHTSFSIGQHIDTHGSFRWDGIHWSAGDLAHRLAIVGLAAGVALLAAVFFGRFDPEREGRRPTAPAEPAEPAAADSPAARRKRRFALPAWSPAAPFPALVVAELRLMLQGRSGWWYLVALGLLVAGAVAPLRAVRLGILPAAWLWPLALWSPLGAREKLANTRELVFCGPRAPLYGAATQWLAGAVVAAATTWTIGLRLVATGHTGAFGAWLVGCLFIPALAFGLGSISGSTRLFEVVYLLLWYIGPLNRVPGFDYMGVTPQGLRQGMPLVYLALGVGFFATGWAARAGQSRG